jgi:AAA family ATP:ADP antiporter
MERLRYFLNIEPGEERPIFLLFLYLTLALASFTIARAIRDSVFLNHYGAMDLPYAYIAVAVVIGIVVSFYVKLASHLNQAALISGTLLFFILNILVFWWAMPRRWDLLPALFYVWSSIFGVIITAQVWTVAGMILDTRQARRLFPLLGSGGILGGFLGGLIAALAVRLAGTENLILILLLFPACCIVIVQKLSKLFCRNCRVCQRAQSAVDSIQGEHGLLPIVQTIHRSRYLRLIVALFALSAVVTLLVDFQFKLVVQESISPGDALTGFFGSFYAWLGFVSFLLQIVAGRWIVDKYGVRLTLFILPIALLSGTAILLAFPMRLWAGLFLKGSDGTLRYSIDKSTIELLFVPIPKEVRAEIKATIDMVIQRLADGLGGFILLFLTRVLDLGSHGTGLFNVMLLGVWLWLALQIRREHVSSLRANLSERQLVPEHALRAAFLDEDSTDKIRSMLEDANEEVVLYAIELAIAIGRQDLLSTDLVRHRSRAVRSKALDIVPLTESELQDTLAEETDSALKAKIMSRGYGLAGVATLLGAPNENMESQDIHMRLAAATYLLQSTPGQEIQKARDYLRTAIGSLEEDSDDWVHVASALADIHHPAAVGLHMRLMAHSNRAVRKKAILSAGRAGHRELVPVLVRLLASRESSSAARVALQEFGERIVGTLGDIFSDPFEDVEVRRQIPLVLAHIPNQRTVDILMGALPEEDGLLSFRTIRALNHMRISGRDLRFDETVITRRIQAESEKTLWYEHALFALYDNRKSTDLLEQLLREKIHQGRERVFRLLGLLLPPAVAHAAYRAILEKDHSRRANAIEYLDNVLPVPLKKWVMPLLETKKPVFKASMSAILEAFRQSKDPVIRDCTLDAIRKHRWLQARPAVEAPT